MANKKYDIVVSGGSYTNGQGEEKKRWVNVGVVMQGDDGFFALLDPGVNLAAYKEPGKDRVIASLFEPRQQNPQQQSQPQQPQQGQHGPSNDGFSDDIPFSCYGYNLPW